MAQVVSDQGAAAGPPVRLSHYEGTVVIESLVWDGAQHLALLNAQGHRGGRLLLAAIDEQGRLARRDLVIPLDYEPGRLVAARLAAASSHLVLLFSSRRPWDEGILYLARLRLHP
jgi:hypothetical protein